MKNAKRIVIGLIVLVIVMIIFYITVNFFKEKQYKYMTSDNEFGISNKCILDDNQFALCLVEGSYRRVVQFYEV